MAEEDLREEQEDGAADAPGASKAPAAAKPEVSAADDPLDTTGVDDKASFLSRLNPFRMLRRRSLGGLLAEAKDLLANGSLAQATVIFQKILQADPNCVPAYRGLGKVFFKKGGRSNMEIALKHYQDAIRCSPMEHDLYAITAKIYDGLGKRKEATLERKKFVIVRALDADDRNPIANNNMGILFLQQGRMTEALAYFNKAVQSDRSYDVAYRNLAAAYFQMAKKATDEKKAEYNRKARESIQKALNITPAVPTLMAHARILMLDGNLEQVLGILEQVDQMDPANPDVYNMKKMVFEGLGRFEEARSAQESYLAFKKGPAPAAEVPE